MRVAVRYMAQLRQAVGVAAEQVELDEDGTVAELVVRLADRHGDSLQRLLLATDGRVQPTILVFVGDEQVGPPELRNLREGDVVTLLSPIAGGERTHG